MLSDDTVISVSNLSKCYQIYDAPLDRLKQFFLPRLQRLFKCQQKQYFREFWALENINFEVKRGQAVGIIGRNGSGKSTLLQIITGTLTPTSGNILTNGRIAALLELGSGFNPDFTGRENVYLNGALLGFSPKQVDERFEAISSFADIGEHMDQPVKTYSSGMLVRLAFSVQVQVEPDILIVDEALAVGDALFQKRCFQRIEKLVSNGTTLLFVSHDQESVRTLTNRALLLNKGKAFSWGVSSEVVLDYRRLLHDEESNYFSRLAKELVTSGVQSKANLSTKSVENELSLTISDSEVSVLDLKVDRLSFGDEQVKILQVETFNSEGTPSSFFYPGERIRINVTCESRLNIQNLNVAIRIRSKEGVKIYSWGTLNQDMTVLSRKLDMPVFWERAFQKGEKFQVMFESDCNLGVNLYEIQAAVSFEETPDYMSQRLLHWIDEAAFFQVSMKRDEYFFGGVVDLRMNAIW